MERVKRGWDGDRNGGKRWKYLYHLDYSFCRHRLQFSWIFLFLYHCSDHPWCHLCGTPFHQMFLEDTSIKLIWFMLTLHAVAGNLFQINNLQLQLESTFLVDSFFRVNKNGDEELDEQGWPIKPASSGKISCSRINSICSPPQCIS